MRFPLNLAISSAMTDATNAKPPSVSDHTLPKSRASVIIRDFSIATNATGTTPSLHQPEYYITGTWNLNNGHDLHGLRPCDAGHRHNLRFFFSTGILKPAWSPDPLDN